MNRSDKLRIAFVTNEFVTEEHFYGGLANYTYRATKELASLGHDVHVITHSKVDESEFDCDGIHIHRVGISPLPIWLRWLSKGGIEGSSADRIYFNIQVYRKLKEIDRKTSLDIVQFTNVYASGLLSGPLLHIPYVIRMSSYRPLWDRMDGRKRDFDHKLHEWLEWIQIRFGKHVYTPSYRMRKILEREMKIKNVKVIRSPVYIETNGWDAFVYDRLLKGKEYLLFFGRFQIRKGFHILAQALAGFLKKHPEAYAVFVGPDYSTTIASSMKEYARSLCKESADRLIFMEQKHHNELYPIISGAKIVVLPSLFENFPNSCLEAMLLGKPTIGTLGTSFEEVITDEKTGFLVPPNDTRSLAEKIDRAWNHPDLDKIGSAAQKKIEEFTPAKTIQELLQYFQEVIKHHRVR